MSIAGTVSVGRPGRRLRGAAGFTLIEVLVATAILAAVMTAAMAVYSSSLAGSARLGGYQRAMEIARDRMARLGTRFDITASRSAGETDDGYRWQTRVRPYTPVTDGLSQAVGSLQPYEVSVTVSWTRGAHPYHFDLHSMRLGRSP